MLNWLKALFISLVNAVLSLLPTSPFRDLINNWSVSANMGFAWLNWFLDISGMLTILSVWLTAYVAYLLISIILRWIKAID